MLYVNIKKKLNKFDLDIEFNSHKEKIGFLGSSGSGKSMTLKCIAGVETPDEGEIILNDKILFSSKKKINMLPQKRKVGLLFQNYALFPNMNIYNNINISIARDLKDKNQSINNIIKNLSLEGLEKNYPHELSGGQQQRVALARILLNNPDIFMLDEPFSALDDHLRWNMEEILNTILQKNKNTILYVSHNKDEIYRLSDKIMVFNNGKIEEYGEKHEIFNRPKTTISASLIGCKNIFKIEKINENKIYINDLQIKLSNVKSIENREYIGIYSNGFSICETPEDNVFHFRIINIIQNINFYTLVVSSKDTNSLGKLYIDVSLEEYNKIKDKDNINIKIKVDEILFLK